LATRLTGDLPPPPGVHTLQRAGACGPAFLAAPGGPGSPCAPVAPVGHTGPVAHIAPVVPCGPVPHVFPVAPAGRCSRCTQEPWSTPQDRRVYRCGSYTTPCARNVTEFSNVGDLTSERPISQTETRWQKVRNMLGERLCSWGGASLTVEASLLLFVYC
jgi:hypothetical protein